MERPRDVRLVEVAQGMVEASVLLGRNMKIVCCDQCEDVAEWRGTVEEMGRLGWTLTRAFDESGEDACIFWLCKKCSPTYH